LAGAARRIDPRRLARIRAAAQGFHRPTSITDPVDVVRAGPGLQAQDPYAAKLSFRSRCRRATGADIDRARTQDRSLLRTWLMRMTIHMIATEDAGWTLPLFEPLIEKWTRRRLAQLGIPPRSQEKALRVIERALDDGPESRPELAERIGEAGIELDQYTRNHLSYLAVSTGIACLGPDRGRTTLLVRREDWLDKPPRFDRRRALAELSRRYLRAFGPATEHDFAYWAGLPLRDVREGLAAIPGELEEVRAGERTLLRLRGRAERIPRKGQLRMLGEFDNYMLGYRDRDFAVPPGGHKVIKEAGGGWIRAVIVEDGRMVGGWSSRRKDGRLEITLRPLGRLSAARRKAVDAEIADIERFEGVPVSLTVA